MKVIAVTSEGPTLDSMMDSRFGRAAGFLIVNMQTMETQYIDNGSTQAMAQGAGIQAAEIISKVGAKDLLTGYVGPKAEAALNAAGIAMHQGYEDMTVQEAINRFTAGQGGPAAG